MTQEALTLALEALKRYGNRHRATYLLDGAWDAEITLGDKAFAAIKEALAQTQEPRNVRERWNVELDGNDLLVCFNDHEKGNKCQYERYSPQRTWVGLASEDRLTAKYMQDAPDGIEAVIDYIEAKLKEKNT
jgi:hypothetical protein